MCSRLFVLIMKDLMILLCCISLVASFYFYLNVSFTLLRISQLKDLLERDDVLFMGVQEDPDGDALYIKPDDSRLLCEYLKYKLGNKVNLHCTPGFGILYNRHSSGFYEKY